MNNDIKEITIEIRKKSGLKLPDCIIIASARYLHIAVITADKQFKKVDDADLIFYEK